MEQASIQWSGGSIAVMTFCAVVFLIWLSVMIGNRRERRERAIATAIAPEIKHVMVLGKTYRLLLKSQPAVEGIKFVGHTGMDWNDPLKTMALFTRADGRRIAIKAVLIQVIEEM